MLKSLDVDILVIKFFDMKFIIFEDMEIRQLSMKLLSDIYRISDQWLFKTDFWLKEQIRKAITSVSSNIVEWFERQNNNEFIRFLKIAKWSSWEVRNQLYAASYAWYINQNIFEDLKNASTILSKKICTLILYLEKNKKQWNFKTT